MQLLQLRMPNEYIIHVICLLILPTETLWSLYGINNIRKSCLTLTCIIYLICKIRLPIVIGQQEWCLMTQKIINYLTTIILSILFPLAQWASIEMPSNNAPKFPIATGEWATAKRTPWVGGLVQGLGGWCNVCVCCESGFSVLMVGPGICILCQADSCAS